MTAVNGWRRLNARGRCRALTTAIGHLYRQCGRWDEAASAFRRAIASDPASAAAHEGLADALLVTGDAAGAADAALDAARLRHHSATAHGLLAEALTRLGDDTRAAVHRALARAGQ